MNRIEYETESPVLLIFFNRPDTFKKVFERVREVRPKTLFLAQDGPRDSDDIPSIEACRKIAEKVDWDCVVHRNYSNINLGCDPNEYRAFEWAFSKVDRLIILEDDCIASYSFFKFCDELLEKYKDDQRIQTISGFQRLDKYTACPYSYYFSMINAGLGWATWKRVWEDALKHTDYPVLESEYYLNNLKKLEKKIFPVYYNETSNILKKKKLLDSASGKHTTWETIMGETMMLESRLSISPCFNLIMNIGLTDDSTHATSDLRMIPKKIRRLFFIPAYELEFPLKHPPIMMRDMEYEKQSAKIFPSTNFSKCMVKINYAFRVLVFKGPRILILKIIKKVRN
ncbi:hypothetical protein [Thomasclavelia sp.]